MTTRRYNVLLVEDDRDDAKLVETAFATLDPNAHIYVTPGAEAVMWFLDPHRLGKDDDPIPLPDVIILDILMPGMDGVGFLEWCATRSESLPVVVFTSSDDPRLASRCLELGARQFLEKSTDFRELVSVVQRVIGVGQHTGSTRYTVLVVEDDPDDSTLIKSVFAHFDPDARVSVTRSAEEALAYLRGPWADTDLGRSELPDVIVLDILMPGMGGLGFLEWFASQPELADVPVIVFTSSEDPDLADKCFALGAWEFKMKPFDFTELVEVVHQVLDRWLLERERKSS